MIKKMYIEIIGKIKKLFLEVFFIILLFITTILLVDAAVPIGLIPTNTGLPGDSKKAGVVLGQVGGELISNLIQYVAVIAVISLMISGIMYLISGGEEEKVKKAKTWIISSLVGVLLSISAWVIIKIINNITI